jgi:hypothetical protein
LRRDTISAEEASEWLKSNYRLDHKPYFIEFDYDRKDYRVFTIRAIGRR